MAHIARLDVVAFVKTTLPLLMIVYQFLLRHTSHLESIKPVQMTRL